MLSYNVRSTHEFLRKALRKPKHWRQCVPDFNSSVHMYRISSIKWLDAYFLQDIQGPAFKQDRRLFDS